MTMNTLIIRDSFELAKPIAKDVVDYFYGYLWETYPDSKIFFKNTKMEKQKAALIKSLVFIVDNLENEMRLKAYLENMGRNHVKYGVKPEHYPWVGDSLIHAFAHFFKEKWTKELEEQWTLAYGFIADAMIPLDQKAVEEPLVTAPSKQDTVQKKDLDIHLSEEVKQKIKEHIRKQFSLLISEEYEHSISDVEKDIQENGITEFLKKSS